MEQKYAALQAKMEADNSLVVKLFALENANEVQDLLKTQDLDFSLEEINTLKSALVKSAQKGELSEEDLEEVAGGFVITAAIVGTIAGICGATFGAGNFVHNVTRGRW